MKNDILKHQRFLVIHGTLILLTGFIIGFGFLFFITGNISLYQMPGTYDAWRMAQMEGIINGLMLWLIAALLPVFSTFVKNLKWLVILPPVISWSIVIGASFDPLFPDARGLVFDATTNLMNDISFFVFFPGVFLCFVLVIGILVSAWKHSRNPS